jgi:hypothetical protein
MTRYEIPQEDIRSLDMPMTAQSLEDAIGLETSEKHMLTMNSGTGVFLLSLYDPA